MMMTFPFCCRCFLRQTLRRGASERGAQKRAMICCVHVSGSDFLRFCVVIGSDLEGSAAVRPDMALPRRLFRVKLPTELNFSADTSWSSTSSCIATGSRPRPSPASCPTASTRAAAPPTPAITSALTATRDCSPALSSAAIIADKQWNN